MLIIVSYISGGFLGKCYSAICVLRYAAIPVDEGLFSIAMSVLTLLVLMAFSTSAAACVRNVVWWFVC